MVEMPEGPTSPAAGVGLRELRSLNSRTSHCAVGAEQYGKIQ